MGSALDLVNALRGWTPIRIRTGGAEPTVQWAMLDAPPRDPFFEQSAERAMRHPFNAAFARHTPIAALDAFANAPLQPAGFVFHMSRCGSTLVAQMLSRLSRSVVISEAQPVDALLRLAAAGPPEERAAQRLRGLIAALGAACEDATRVFVKFQAWHVLELPLLARAFPSVPWIFLFRAPDAVLRSQTEHPGAELFPETLDPRYIGATTAEELTAPDYGARVLAAFCEAALRHADVGRSAFVDYEALPEAVFTRVVPFFGVDPTEDETTRMRDVAKVDTKRGDRDFSPPAATADARVRAIAERWLDAPYAALRARSAAPIPTTSREA